MLLPLPIAIDLESATRIGKLSLEGRTLSALGVTKDHTRDMTRGVTI